MTPLVRAILLLIHLPYASACTALLVGRKATVDGSVLVSHSDDGEGIADPRILQIASHAVPSRRDIRPDLEDNDRYAGEPIGSIPIPTQLNKTYAYFDGNYGIINTKQVMVGGESTCSAVFTADAVPKGQALLSVNELSRIALEYTATARQAIQLMGQLAEEHGFYGPSSGFEGGAESLLVADPQEGFVFHILPDDTGTKAIWIAQRVPDDHVTIVTNMFTIRQVHPSDPHNFLGNFEYMYQVAQRNHLWRQSDGPLDFTRTFSNGEYAHKYYSGRRIWGAYRLLAPSLQLDSMYDNLQTQSVYPWSIQPDKVLSLQDLFRVHRDYYQDTQFDLSQGLAAGPFGNPDRFAVPHHQRHAMQKKYFPHGPSTTTGVGWERPIGLFRTTYTTVSQARSWLDDSIGGVLWLGTYAPHGTCFLPFAAGVTSLPDSITKGSMTQLDRSTAFWTFRYIHNLARLRYDLLSQVIQEAQAQWEGIALQMQQSIQDLPQVPAADKLTELYHNHTAHVLEAWWNLADDLVFRYADGFDNYKPDAPALGYSVEWLEGVGYQNGPPPPPAPIHSSTQQAESTATSKTNILFCVTAVLLVVALYKLANGCHRRYNPQYNDSDSDSDTLNDLALNGKHHHHTQTPETVRSCSMDSLDFIPLEKTKYGSLQ